MTLYPFELDMQLPPGTRMRFADDGPTYGQRLRLNFPNGYGVSIIRSPLTKGGLHGRWEIGVLYDDDLTYDTPITSDVLGYLRKDDVARVVAQVVALGGTR
jgi:hypothetical protein